MKIFEEIRIENTNQCAYKCFFCPREKLTRTKGFMSLEDLSLVLNNFNDHEGYIDLHGFGEPLLDKLLCKKIELIKSVLPSSTTRIYSTLGTIHHSMSLKDLVQIGLDVIHVSFYGINKESYLQSHGVDMYDTAKKNLEELCLIKKELKSDIKIIVRDFPRSEDVGQPGVTTSGLFEFKQWLTNLNISDFIERSLHNYGDGRQYNQPNTNAVCSVVNGFRKRVLQISWDLNVIPCCFDYNSTVIFGNLKDNTIDNVFNSDIYNDFIESHEKNELEKYPVCLSCDKCLKS